MKINISKRIFNEDPALRFAKEFKCQPLLWREAWKRYKFYDYSKKETREYLEIKLKKQIHSQRFKRWTLRTEIYNKAQIMIKKGATEIPSEYFGILKEFVEKEINKNN